MFSQSDYPKDRSFMRSVAVLLTLVLLAGPAMGDEQEEPSTTEEFMADRGRVGAVVGSILAGAAIANPFASLAGNVIGFVIGKTSDFTKDEEPGENTVKASGWRRGIVPEASASSTASNGTEGGVPTLAIASAPVPNPDVSIASVPLGGFASEDKPKEKPQEPDAEKRPTSDENSETAVVADSGTGDEAGNDVSEDEMQAAVEEEKSDIGQQSGSQAPESQTRSANGGGVPNLVITKDVGGEQAQLEALAATIRKEQDREVFEPHPQCPSREAPKYRKSVAVTAFTLETPSQGAFGSLYNAGETVADLIYQKFNKSGNIAPYFAPTRQMFASLDMAPTRFAAGNGLEKYSAVSREMGVQFVVAGVIRDLSVSSPNTWDSSYYSNAKRALFGGDLNRTFVVDVVVYDGFTGHVVMERRYAGDGRWEFSRRDKVQFGSDRFLETDYGQVVDKVIGDISTDIVDQLACQPMLVEIRDVDGKDLILDVGTESGLLPGTYMKVVRKEHSLRAPGQPPQLWDTGVELHVHKLSLNSARAWMPEYAGAINIQPGDYAVLY